MAACGRRAGVDSRDIIGVPTDIHPGNYLRISAKIGISCLIDAIASDHVIRTYDVTWADGNQPLRYDPPKRAAWSFAKADRTAFTTHLDLAMLPI